MRYSTGARLLLKSRASRKFDPRAQTVSDHESGRGAGCAPFHAQRLGYCASSFWSDCVTKTLTDLPRGMLRFTFLESNSFLSGKHFAVRGNLGGRRTIKKQNII